MQRKIRIGQNKQASQLATTTTKIEENEPKIKHEFELQRHRCSCTQGSSKTTKMGVMTYAAVPTLYCLSPNSLPVIMTLLTLDLSLFH